MSEPVKQETESIDPENISKEIEEIFSQAQNKQGKKYPLHSAEDEDGYGSWGNVIRIYEGE